MKDKDSFWSLTMQDLSRFGRPGLVCFFKQYFLPRGGCFPFVFWFRIIQATGSLLLWKILLYPIIYPIYRHMEFKYGIHINHNVQVGGGLKIVHGGCVHLNCSRIGKNFTAYHNVTLGGYKEAVPSVEDNVTIFPGAVVTGRIVLHSGSTVGALSYVSHDVDAGCIVVGAPAKVLNRQ